MGKKPHQPTGPEVDSALELLKARALAHVASIPNIVPGTQAWKDLLSRYIENEVRNASFLSDLASEVTAAIALVQGGKGPVTHDPVDLA